MPAYIRLFTNAPCNHLSLIEFRVYAYSIWSCKTTNGLDGMFLRIWRLCVFAVALTVIAACKNVVVKPLVGSAHPGGAPGISGKWTSVAVNEAIALEIKGQENDGWYDFSFAENGHRTVGEFRVGYFGDRLIFNVNVASLVSEGSKLLESPEPRFLLFGAQFLDGNLVIVSAKMDVFEAKFAEYLDGEPRSLTDRCASSEKEDTSKAVPCSIPLSSAKVISLTETPAFHRALLSNYDDVFSMEDVLVLKPNN